MTEKVETVKVEVEFAKAMIDYIQSQEWFKSYRGITDFIEEAVRQHMYQKMKIDRS